MSKGYIMAKFLGPSVNYLMDTIGGEVLDMILAFGKNHQFERLYLFIQQLESETLYGTRERYKKFLRICPQHRIVEWMQIQIFFFIID